MTNAEHTKNLWAEYDSKKKHRKKELEAAQSNTTRLHRAYRDARSESRAYMRKVGAKEDKMLELQNKSRAAYLTWKEAERRELNIIAACEILKPAGVREEKRDLAKV